MILSAEEKQAIAIMEVEHMQTLIDQVRFKLYCYVCMHVILFHACLSTLTRWGAAHVLRRVKEYESMCAGQG